MGQIIHTHELTPESVLQYGTRKLDQIYNALDCCITMEVLEEQRRMQNSVPIIYDFERALQAPALEMMLRGFRVDQYERGKCIEELRRNISFLEQRLQRMFQVFLTAPLEKDKKKLRERPNTWVNPNSGNQLREFFYKHMHLPEVWSSSKGKRSLAMDRETLEKLSQNHYATPIINALLSIREDTKSLKVLETEVDPDGRMRTSYNIAATETGRWSSSKNAFGSGGNLQNWKERLRRVMVADLGWKLGAIDLEQADAREIGFTMGVLFGDWTYLNACEEGDLHTTTCRLVWPEMPWTGDLKKDRVIAEMNFYRDFTFRDMSKRGGHGTVYVGTPFTMSRHLKVAIRVMELFQDRFFNAYPSIPKLHLWTSAELQSKFKLQTYFGRERHFFGRPNDDATLREGVAFLGQAPTADRMSLGVYNLWDRLRHRIKLVGQLHDAVYFLYPEREEQEIIPLALNCCQITVSSPCGRPFMVPGEAKVGWNWSKRHDDSKPLDPKKNPFNPNGLVKFKLGKPDERKRVDIF